MNIVHICCSLDGGAGLCTQRIMNATSKLGLRNKVLVIYGSKSDQIDVIQYEYPWSKSKIIKKGQTLLSIVGRWPKEIKKINQISKKIDQNKSKCNIPFTFTSPVTKYKKIARHPWIIDADIIHLHWVGYFLDYESFFKEINKPIVWTLHDENPGLGGFHYSSWKDKAPESFRKLDDELMQIKSRAYKSLKSSMTLVAISEKMSQFIKENPLLRGFPSTIIHNGIDGDSFVIINKETAREALSISKEKMVFLFAAYDIYDQRKGLGELINALEKINNPNILLVCLGNYKKKPDTTLDVRCEGFISNSQILSIYYSAADYFVMPSFQEAFAQTPMEAMACGTPVIAFPCSGTEELISEDNGVICEDFTVSSLIKGIQKALKYPFKRDSIRNNLLCRFSYDVIAKKYISLYDSILSVL